MKMDKVCWVQLQGSDLVEHQSIHETFDTSRLVLLVRGPKFPLPARACFVQKVRSTVLVDCHLHLDPILAGDPSQALHDTEDKKADETANRFYSLALLPMCSCVIFIEEEFGGIDNLMYDLGKWASNSTDQQHRPPVFISRASPTALSTDDLENRLTGQILKHSNPLRERTNTSAKQVWTACFSTLKSIYGAKSDSDLCKDAVSMAETSSLSALNNTSSLMHAAIVHFSSGTSRPFNVIAALRAFPVSDQLSKQIHRMLKSVREKSELVSALFVAASALAFDTHLAGIDGKLQSSTRFRHLGAHLLIR